MDFSQNYCLVTKYDGVSDVLRKVGTVPRGSLVKVEGNRLKVFQGKGEVIIDAPASGVHVRPAGKATPSVASIDVGENHWLIDFGVISGSAWRLSPSLDRGSLPTAHQLGEIHRAAVIGAATPRGPRGPKT